MRAQQAFPMEGRSKGPLTGTGGVKPLGPSGVNVKYAENGISRINDGHSGLKNCFQLPSSDSEFAFMECLAGRRKWSHRLHTHPCPRDTLSR